MITIANLTRGTCILCQQSLYVDEATGLCSTCAKLKATADLEANLTPKQKAEREKASLCQAVPYSQALVNASDVPPTSHSQQSTNQESSIVVTDTIAI